MSGAADRDALDRLRGQQTALRAFDTALDTAVAGGATPGVSGSRGARVAGAYLLHGPEGVGRSLAARGFAAALLCRSPRDARPCGACRSCAWTAAGTHPDFLAITGVGGPFFKDDAASLKAGIGQFTQAHHRSAADGPARTIPVRTVRRLMDLLSLSAAGGGRKVALVDSLDEIEEEGVAGLLKILEEPPRDTTFLVLARGLDGVPDTVLSRCQRVRFRPLAPDVVRSLLNERLPPDERPAPDVLARVVRLSQGSVGRALAALGSGVAERGGEFVETLLAPHPHGVREAVDWVREAGRDLASQRVRVREFVALAVLELRDRAGRRRDVGELDALLPVFTGALESIASNVAPDLVLHALWARVDRARRLTT